MEKGKEDKERLEQYYKQVVCLPCMPADLDQILSIPGYPLSIAKSNLTNAYCGPKIKPKQKDRI